MWDLFIDIDKYADIRLNNHICVIKTDGMTVSTKF